MKASSKAMIPQRKHTDRRDAHAHVFLRSDGAVANSRYQPNYDAPLSSWLERLDKAGLSGGTLVQPSFLGTDNTRLLRSIAVAREQGYDVDGSAVVANSVNPEYLQELVDANITALRLNCIKRDLPNFKQAQWQSFFATVAQSPLSIELHIEADRFHEAGDAILNHGIHLILDHYGLVKDADQLASMLDLCDRDNMTIKRSAPYRLPVADADGLHALLTSVEACLTEMLPANQIKWGSDWPHTQFEKHVAKQQFQSE